MRLVVGVDGSACAEEMVQTLARRHWSSDDEAMIVAANWTLASQGVRNALNEQCLITPMSQWIAEENERITAAIERREYFVVFTFDGLLGEISVERLVGAALVVVDACHAEAAAATANVAVAKPQSVPPQVVMCCAKPPQFEPERVALPTPNQTALPTALPMLAYHALVSTAVIPGGKSPPPLKRPLYLALSCWLL